MKIAKNQTQEEIKQLKNISGGLEDLPVDFSNYQNFLKFVKDNFKDSVEAEDMSKIIKSLVYKIEIGVDSIKIYYYAGQDSLGVLANFPKTPKKVYSNSLTIGAQGRT